MSVVHDRFHQLGALIESAHTQPSRCENVRHLVLARGKQGAL